MSRPAILAVDDDGPVLAAVERDLRERYAEHYQVLAASSGDQALDLLRRLRLREDAVALLLVDQRMPGMSGKIGRASCRERVQISVVAVSLKKNKGYKTSAW